MICSNCGSSNIKDKIIEGYDVKECQVCDFLYGNGEFIKKIEEIREARVEGIDPLIYPLHKLLNKMSDLKIEYSCPGYSKEKIPPYVSFVPVNNRLGCLKEITKALTEINKKTKKHWIVEVTYQKQLVYILKPEFHSDAYNITIEQICDAQKDIKVLTEELISLGTK